MEDKLWIDACGHSPPPIPTSSTSGSFNAVRGGSKLTAGTGDILMRMSRRVSQAFNFRSTYHKPNEE